MQVTVVVDVPLLSEDQTWGTINAIQRAFRGEAMVESIAEVIARYTNGIAGDDTALTVL